LHLLPEYPSILDPGRLHDPHPLPGPHEHDGGVLQRCPPRRNTFPILFIYQVVAEEYVKRNSFLFSRFHKEHLRSQDSEVDEARTA
jgi:hypothetical protein